MVVLIKSANKWIPATLTSWSSEQELQEVLADSPELMPGCEGSAVVTELRIPGVGSVDLVCVHDTGAITLVECKLAKNAEIRRAVVGQIFAYASGLSGMSAAEFGQLFGQRSKITLSEAVSEVASPDFSPDAFEAELAETLLTGRFRLLIVVDQITSELRAIVEYLNNHLAETVTIVALELGRVLVGEAQLLVPRTYGAETADRRDKIAGVKTRWTAADIEETVSAIDDPAVRSFFERVLVHAKEHDASLIGGTGSSPSTGVYYPLGTMRRSILSLFPGADPPSLSLNVAVLGRVLPSRAHRVVAALRRSTAFAGKLSGDDDLAITKYPEVHATVLAESTEDESAFWEALRLATSEDSERPPTA